MYYQNSSMTNYDKLYRKSDNIALRHNYFIKFKMDKDALKVDEEWMPKIEKKMNTQLIRNKIKRSIQHRKLKSGLRFTQFYASSFDQLLVGFGNIHIHETSLNFHPVYGNPYISGSMLKGISKAQAVKDVKSSLLSKIDFSQNIYLSSLNNLIDFYPLTKKDCTLQALKKAAETKISVNEVVKNKIEKKTKCFTLCDSVLELFQTYFNLWWEGKSQNIKEIDNQKLKELFPEFWFSRIIFGNQGNVGNIVFYDAFTDNNELNLARFTPHNQDYFNKENKVPPGDYQQPVPLIYLAIPKKSRFFFEISAPSNCPDEIFKKAKYWFQTALEKNGVGAKTSSGFGYFSDFEQLSDEDIENADYEFLPQQARFEDGLQKGTVNSVEKAITRLSESKLSEKNKLILIEQLKAEEFYLQYDDKVEIIKQLCHELEKGCMQNFEEQQILSILKTLEKFATGKQKKEVKELRGRLFSQKVNETKELKISVDNLKSVFAEIQEGKHNEMKKDYCQNMVNLLKKRRVKNKFKDKFVKEVNDYCFDILKE